MNKNFILSLVLIFFMGGAFLTGSAYIKTVTDQMQKHHKIYEDILK
jgi:hypothetical protein